MFGELFPILTTPDVSRAPGFSRELLGGTVFYQFPAEGDPGYAGVRIGGSPWGERTATVLDPDGNRVLIATR